MNGGILLCEDIPKGGNGMLLPCEDIAKGEKGMLGFECLEW